MPTILVCSANISFANLIFVRFFSYLDATSVLWQAHIGRVCPRFVGDGREEAKGPKWGLGIGDTLVQIIWLIPTSGLIQPLLCRPCRRSPD